jgi:hypothetical protein
MKDFIDSPLILRIKGRAGEKNCSGDGPDAALSVWILEQQEVTEMMFNLQFFLFLHHAGVQRDVWTSSRRRCEAAHV